MLALRILLVGLVRTHFVLLWIYVAHVQVFISILWVLLILSCIKYWKFLQFKRQSGHFQSRFWLGYVHILLKFLVNCLLFDGWMFLNARKTKANGNILVNCVSVKNCASVSFYSFTPRSFFDFVQNSNYQIEIHRCTRSVNLTLFVDHL